MRRPRPPVGRRLFAGILRRPNRTRTAAFAARVACAHAEPLLAHAAARSLIAEEPTVRFGDDEMSRRCSYRDSAGCGLDIYQARERMMLCGCRNLDRALSAQDANDHGVSFPPLGTEASPDMHTGPVWLVGF
jgi:hypothetical protein